ncbi:MAG TPA: glycosyltransferase family A protein [Flavisolibacter sp.]|jgi:glycosyltransferase involved in cell wall biosynthesis|nr:glycosyltransferase family A protein [Flavisolibacter sp.]
MSTKTPFFTIIIPTYNREKLIAKTLNSVLNQEFQSFEIIVIDDGGNDNTESVVKAFETNKIVYVKKKNEERGAARNLGWKIASGEYVTFLDSDDIFYPNHLKVAFESIKNSNPVCYAQAYEIKNAFTNKQLVKPYFSNFSTINDQLIKENILSCFGVFLKKDLFKEVQFEEDRNLAGTEDWLLWLQLAARYPVYYNNECTGALLEHNERSVLSFKEESLIFRAELIKKKLMEDSIFINKFSISAINNIYAHMLSYASLHLAIGFKRRRAIYYLIKAVKINIHEISTRRFFAIAKKLFSLK